MHAALKYVGALGSCAALAAIDCVRTDSPAKTAKDKYSREGARRARVLRVQGIRRAGRSSPSVRTKGWSLRSSAIP